MEKARGGEQAWLGGRGSAHILRSGSPRAQRSVAGAPGVYPGLAPMPNAGTRPGPLRVGSSRVQPCNASGLAREDARTDSSRPSLPVTVFLPLLPDRLTALQACEWGPGQDQGDVVSASSGIFPIRTQNLRMAEMKPALSSFMYMKGVESLSGAEKRWRKEVI